MKYRVTVETDASGAVLEINAVSEKNASEKALTLANESAQGDVVFRVTNIEIADGES